jgi:hypothetical protein
LSSPETLGLNSDRSDGFDLYDDTPGVRSLSWGNLTTYNGSVPDG